MTHPQVWILAAAGIFGVALYGLIVSGEVMRQVIALKLMGSAVFLMLVATAGPIDGRPDAIPLALVLTGIVIAVSASAFALTLLVRLAEVTGSASLDDDEGADGR